MRRRNALHALKHLHAALGLPRLRGLRFEASDVALQVLHLTLLALVQRLLLRQLRGPLVFEARVVTAVGGDTAMFEAEDAVRHAVEELAVMGDDQQRTGVGQQPAFKPQHGVEVEVVGGFVQQQDVRRAHECLRQRQPYAPAAGESVDGACLVFGREPEAGHERGGATARRPATGDVEVRVSRADTSTITTAFGRCHLAFSGAHGGVAIHHEFHGSAAIRRHFLRHAGQHLARGPLHVAGVRMQFTGDQGEQARLAGTVGADDAGAVATEQAEAGVLEEGARAAAEGDLSEVNHGARSLAAPTVRASVRWQ